MYVAKAKKKNVSRALFQKKSKWHLLQNRKKTRFFSHKKPLSRGKNLLVLLASIAVVL